MERYLSEVISAVAEGLQKVKTTLDIAAAVETVSALHQRFQHQFTPHLTYALAKGLATPRPDVLKALTPEQKEREEKERLSRQRVLLRVAVELWLVGVIRTIDDAASVDEASGKQVAGGKSSSGSGPAGASVLPKRRERQDGEADPFPLDVLKDLLGRDREHINLPLVVLFVKNFSYDLLGVKPRSTHRKNVGGDGITTASDSKGTGAGTTNGNDAGGEANDTYSSADENDPPLVKAELQKRFKTVLERYMGSVHSHIVRQHKFLREQNQRNAEAYIKSGEVFEDRQTNYEKLVKAQEKFIANAQVVSDVVGMEMPDLPTETEDGNAGDSIIREGSSMFAARGEEGRYGIWEDEDQKKFYEDLMDLKNRVPGILLEDGKKKKSADEEEKVKKPNGSTTAVVPKVESENTAVGAETAEDKTEDTSTVIANKTIGAQVDALLVRLPELTNRDLIDQAAVDFCFVNSKASRNRLLKVLEEVPRGRQDLLPYYSRLVATLNKYMPDIGTNLVSYVCFLEALFQSHYSLLTY